MPQYVHPGLSRAGDDADSSVELVVVPVTGQDEQVKEAVRNHGGTYSEEPLGFLAVELPTSAIDSFTTVEAIRSITPADATIRDQSQGNL